MSSSDKKIAVVTGGAGFIGTHLCGRLLREGYEVLSLDNYSTGSKDNHIEGVVYIEGQTHEISDAINVKPTIVFHLGEYARVEQSFNDISTVIESNQRGTAAVLEFVRMKGSKLLYAGSSTKFADAGIGRDQSPYAWTKASNTNLVQRYGDWFDIPYAITYFYNVYGPGERGDATSGTLVGIFAEKSQNGDALTIRKPGTQRRNFTHVYDIVDGLILVGEQGIGDEYGLGHPDSYSVQDVADMFGGEHVYLEDRPGNRSSSGIDVHRAQLELGWEPKHNLPDYIKSLKDEA